MNHANESTLEFSIMDILKPIVRHVTAPYYSRRDGYSYRHQQRELEASQWLSRDEIREIQQRRLRELLDFAYRHNRFHRARMEAAGVVPSDIGDAAQLAALPVLSKDDIREAGRGLFSEGYSPDNTQHTRTGGSTGVPLHVYVDRTAMNWKYAATWRHNGWAGWRPGDKVAAVWGDTDKGFHWKAWLRQRFQHRTIFLDTLKFSADRLRQFHGQIVRYRPSVMMGHAHSVYQFARFCQEHDLKVRGLNGIVTTAMTLLETERSVIEQGLGAKVFNRYGCEELSIIASESEAHAGLHAFSEGLILEYLPTAVDGEFELVITDLFNRAMPMIRYAIGDVARPAQGACPSGRGLERLERVSGRTADFLYREDGTPVFGISILDTFVIHIPGIRQAQIVQEALDHLTVNLVPDKNFGPETEMQLRNVFVDQFGSSVTVHIITVDQLPQTERGKYRFSICLINEQGNPSLA
jgi:phenylacetate-CoA ligase